MNQKQIGFIIVAFAIIIGIIFYSIKIQQDNLAMQYAMMNNGSCVTQEGVCLHARANNYFYLGLGISTFLLALGLYLIYFDKTQSVLAEHQKKIAAALKEAKQSEKFEAFLAGFNDDEKKVLKAVKEQDGILQSTLRYRTGISKTSLSLILKGLEDKGVISRKEQGKSNKVFLKKVY